MLRTIHCNACNKSGVFDIHFKFMLESHLCEKCHHHLGTDWDYHFCNITCLMEWLQKHEIAAKGFPCRDCRYITCLMEWLQKQAWETRVTSEAS